MSHALRNLSPKADAVAPPHQDGEGATATHRSMPAVGSLSIVVPVYNSEPSLPVLIERLESSMGSLGIAFDAILVNDGSRDRSWETICELAHSRPWVIGINLMRNYGQHNALLCGIRAATGDVVVTMDDDLQNPPEEIPKLLAELERGFDVVYGRPQKEQHGLLRNLASQITKIVLQNAMGSETARHVSAFRAFRTRLRAASEHCNGPFQSIDVLLTWGTSRFSAVQVRHDPRQIGASNYTWPKLIAHAFNMMTGFSTLPLQIGSLAGFIFTIFGFCVLAYVVGRYLIEGSAVQGFAFLASIVAIFAGVQLFALGMIGEYLARMHFRMMERPTYVVLTTTREE
jgi:glycosyltransferase involved in cell wall biosynthesis